MMISKQMKAVIAGLALSILPTLTMASPSIYFNPTPASGNVSDTIWVDLVWNGDGQNYIGDWDVDIAFDNSIVNLASVSFGTGVDSLGCWLTVTCDATIAAGSVDLYEVSWDFVGDLRTNQDGLGNLFTLATLEFTALAVGTTDLTLTAQAIGDEYGDAIVPALNDGQICVGPCPDGTIPEPPVVLLLLVGTLGLLLQRQISTRHHSS